MWKWANVIDGKRIEPVGKGGVRVRNTAPTSSSGYFAYSIEIKNRAICGAANDVSLTDFLPGTFDCASAEVLGNVVPGASIPCRGTNVNLHRVVGTLPPQGIVIIIVRGRFTTPGTVSNTASFDSSNGGEGRSNTVTFDVTG